MHRQILMELGTFTPYYNQIHLITLHTGVLEAIFDGGIHIIKLVPLPIIPVFAAFDLL